MKTNDVVILEGDAFFRGYGQKNEQLLSSVNLAISTRVDNLELDEPARYFLGRQWDIANLWFEDQLEEINGIAKAFNLAPERLFFYLNATVLEEKYPSAIIQDGCSAWGISKTNEGPLICKNRDYRGEHKNLQAVFLHRHSTIAGGEYVTIGSYGSPGGFSSGMNNCGVAVADTQIPTVDHGVGIVRYLLINKLLCEATSTQDAIDIINTVPHAGGGSLLISDSTGDIATIELGHSATAIERTTCGYNMRTNHFLSQNLKTSYFDNKDNTIKNTSQGRFERMAIELDDFDVYNAVHASKKLLSSHDIGSQTGLCSHGEQSSTLSGAIYLCAKKELIYSKSNPCMDEWHHIQLQS